MSKLTFITRYNLILKKIQHQPGVTMVQLVQHLENKFDLFAREGRTFNVGLSQRTIVRDIEDLRDYGFGIECNNNGYFLDENDIRDRNFERMIEDIDVFNALSLAQNMAPFIHLEKRQPNGTEHLSCLLNAIKYKNQIRFTHQNYEGNEPTQRNAAPYAVKQFRNRWYLIAKDDEAIKSFGLDRLSNITITGDVFEITTPYDVAASFHHYFGIYNPKNQEPEDIVLLFKETQGKYIKSLPLHHSQKIFVEEDGKLRVELKLCLTFDFIKELLSFGFNMKVIKPACLVDEIKAAYENALEQYK